MIDYIKRNSITIISLIVGIAIGFLFTYLVMSRMSKNISDGGQNIVSVDGHSYSADYYYDKLKETDKLSVLLRLIDLDLTKAMYSDQDTTSAAEDYANQQYSATLDSYTYFGNSEESMLSQIGFNSKDEFLNYLKDDYYITKYETEYAGNLATEDEIQKFYDANVFNSKDIYVFVSTKDTNLKNLRNDLKNGVDVDTLTSKYSDVSYSHEDNYYYDDEYYASDVLAQIISLKANQYSKIIENDSNYYVVYVKSVSDSKVSLDDAREDIKERLGRDKLNEDESLPYKATIKLQTDNHIKFYDEELNKAYNDYKAKYDE